MDGETRNDVDELLADADLALFHAKANERNGHALFAPFMRANRESRRALVGEIDQALDAGQMELYYQPQVRLSDLKIIGAEALLRWRHPTRGVVPPSIFLYALCQSVSRPGGALDLAFGLL